MLRAVRSVPLLRAPASVLRRLSLTWLPVNDCRSWLQAQRTGRELGEAQRELTVARRCGLCATAWWSGVPFQAVLGDRCDE